MKRRFRHTSTSLSTGSGRNDKFNWILRGFASQDDVIALHPSGFRATAKVFDERGDGFLEVVVSLDADKVNRHALEEILGCLALALGFAGECFAEGGIAGVD